MSNNLERTVRYKSKECNQLLVNTNTAGMKQQELPPGATKITNIRKRRRLNIHLPNPIVNNTTKVVPSNQVVSRSARPQTLPSDYPPFHLLTDKLGAYLTLLEDPVIEAFHLQDRCCLNSDKYLLAIVLVYFIRTSMDNNDYNRFNFFCALYLAHEIEEEVDDHKWEILPWALGKEWQPRLKEFINAKNDMWRNMRYYGIVSKKACNEIFQAVTKKFPDAAKQKSSFLLRERDEEHAFVIKQTIRLKKKENGTNNVEKHTEVNNVADSPGTNYIPQGPIWHHLNISEILQPKPTIIPFARCRGNSQDDGLKINSQGDSAKNVGLQKDNAIEVDAQRCVLKEVQPSVLTTLEACSICQKRMSENLIQSHKELFLLAEKEAFEEAPIPLSQGLDMPSILSEDRNVDSFAADPDYDYFEGNIGSHSTTDFGTATFTNGRKSLRTINAGCTGRPQKVKAVIAGHSPQGPKEIKNRDFKSNKHSVDGLENDSIYNQGGKVLQDTGYFPQPLRQENGLSNMHNSRPNSRRNKKRQIKFSSEEWSPSSQLFTANVNSNCISGSRSEKKFVESALALPDDTMFAHSNSEEDSEEEFTERRIVPVRKGDSKFFDKEQAHRLRLAHGTTQSDIMDILCASRIEEVDTEESDSD